MNRMTVVPSPSSPGAWEARITNASGSLYVFRIRRTRTRARLAAVRMYLTGVTVAA